MGTKCHRDVPDYGRPPKDARPIETTSEQDHIANQSQSISLDQGLDAASSSSDEYPNRIGSPREYYYPFRSPRGHLQIRPCVKTLHYARS
jgi:hypothetical protein